MSGTAYLESDAWLSPCGRYRYALTRRWAEGPAAAFVMLNPSTADAREDDATVRKCVGFARRWGAGGLVVANLYALRATDPRDLARAADPVGGEAADHVLRRVHDLAADIRWVVAAWGGSLPPGGDARARAVVAIVGPLVWCFGRTRGGQPRHPLMLSYDTRLEEYYLPSTIAVERSSP